MSDETKQDQGAVESQATASASTTPMWLIGLLFILFFGAAWSFDHRGGWFEKQVYQPYTSTEDYMRFQPPSVDLPPRYREGKKIYETCAQCHQLNGLGSSSVGAPPLLDSEWVLAPGPNRLIRIVLNGLRGPIKVKGQDYGTHEMTQFKGAFSDEDIAGVLTYIRYHREWKHNASPVTPEQVKAIRQEEKDRTDPWTAAELLKVPEN